MAEAETAVTRPRRRAGQWAGLILSIPVASLGLMVGWKGEAAYEFLRDTQGNFEDVQWRSIVACRFIAWAALLTGLVQVALAGKLLVSLMAPGRSAPKMKWVWIVIALLLTLSICWGSQMMPTVNLMHALRHRVPATSR